MIRNLKVLLLGAFILMALGYSYYVDSGIYIGLTILISIFGLVYTVLSKSWMAAYLFLGITVTALGELNLFSNSLLISKAINFICILLALSQGLRRNSQV